MIQCNNLENVIIQQPKQINFDNQDILCLNFALGFSFNAFAGRKLLTQEQLQNVINYSIGDRRFWDLGIPKGNGEFLVYGAVYSLKSVHAISANVTVANQSKTLMIFGTREWTKFGPSSPKPFNIMPIKYAYAYGGSEFVYNPDGIGYQAQIGDQLPHIESPDQLIINSDDTPEPASFEPYPLYWPQRAERFRQFADLDFNHAKIHLPTELTPEYFNVAPSDQQINGFFNGNENIKISNMHPLYPTLKTQLPNLKLRVFMIKYDETSQNEIFKEIGSRADTLSLLPNLEVGILQYRTTIAIAEQDIHNIKYIYMALENLDEPRDINFYFDNVLKEYQPQSSQSAQKNDNNTMQTEKYDNHNMTESINELQEAKNHIYSLGITDQDKDKFINERRNAGLPDTFTEEEFTNALNKLGINNPKLSEEIGQIYNILNQLQTNDDIPEIANDNVGDKDESN